jgi:hypothetical protein
MSNLWGDLAAGTPALGKATRLPGDALRDALRLLFTGTGATCERKQGCAVVQDGTPRCSVKAQPCPGVWATAAFSFPPWPGSRQFMGTSIDG